MDLRDPFEVILEHGVHSNCDGAGFMVNTSKGKKSWRLFHYQVPVKGFCVMKDLKLILVDSIDG